MKETDNYSDKYKHNESFVDFLNTSEKFPDWMIIGIFYSALHYMNLFLYSQYNIDIGSINSHVKRNLAINDNCSKNISMQYNTLYDLSRTARYQYIDMSKQLGYAQSCYNKLKTYCTSEVMSKIK